MLKNTPQAQIKGKRYKGLNKYEVVVNTNRYIIFIITFKHILSNF